MYIFLAILMFSFLIFIHEFGHFFTAKLFGVQVNEFSMFMGPAIWKKQVGETMYAIRCIPIGGYCAMEGEDEDTDNPRSFQKADWWKRLIILIAGAAMNFAAGFLIYWGLFGLTPGYETIPMPVISGFYEGNTISGENGLRVGDEISSVDGEKVYIASNISFLLGMNLSDDPATHDLVVIRDGKEVELQNIPMEKTLVQTENGEQLLYGMKLTAVKRTFLSGMRYAWANTLDTVRMVKLSLQMLFGGQAGINDVGGPVMIVQTVSQAAASSGSALGAVLNVLNFCAFLGVNLAVMNLLPIPALDGGRAVCLLLTVAYKKITRKELDPKYEGYLHGAGMILLLGFMTLITFKDIFNIFRG